MMDGKDYAIFVAMTPNYCMYVNALLNSIQKQQLHIWCNLTVYLFHHDMDELPNYPTRAANAFEFDVVPVQIDRADVKHPAPTKRIEFIKRARYAKMAELAAKHDVV